MTFAGFYLTISTLIFIMAMFCGADGVLGAKGAHALALVFLGWIIALFGRYKENPITMGVFCIIVTLAWVQFFMPTDKDVLDYVLPSSCQAQRDYGTGTSIP